MNRVLQLLLIIFIFVIISSCNNNPESNARQSALPYSVAKKEHQQELLDWNKEIVEIDHTVIEKFIERRKWDMKISGTGLYYQIYHKTSGEAATNDKVAEITYSTMLLNGDVLYTSQEYGNRFIHLGHNQDELGLNEGIMLMKVGEKARLILPPHLAFGVPGDGHLVPPYTILVYEIELVALTDKTN